MSYFEEKYVNDRSADFRRYVTSTYGLMCGGLALTFGVSVATAIFLPQLIFSFTLSMILLVAEVITVIAFSTLLRRASFGAVVAMYLFYAVLTGVSISYIFVMFDFGSVILSFAAASVSFGIMALIGQFTKRDLSAFGRLFFAGLVGLILMSIVGIFFWNSVYEVIISIIGLVLFLGITAYDTQRMQRVFEHVSGDQAMVKKFSVYFAMQLYLDFINIFVYLLRLFGRARD